MSRAAVAIVDAEEKAPVRNEVFLTGRLSAAAEERVLPSGDTIVTLRLVVPRMGGARRTIAGPSKGAGSGRTQGSSEGGARVDTIDVVCWTARTRKAALRIRAGTTIEVEGSLRRRFFATPGGRQSRYEVEASVLRRPTSRGSAGT